MSPWEVAHRFASFFSRFGMDASTSFVRGFSAVALAAGLSFTFSTHAQTPRVNPAGLQAGAQNNQFIVQYRADAGIGRLADARERVRRNVALSPALTVSHAIA